MTSCVRRRVVILSLTNVLHEPRVRRQAATFASLGWDVLLAGLRNRQDDGEEWPVIELDPKSCFRSIPTPFKRWSSRSPKMALAHFWSQPGNRYIWGRLAATECDLVIAHDFFTAPIAKRLADRNEVPFVVDSHEYATGQFHFPKDPRRQHRWIRIERPYVDALQKLLFPKAAAITTVCDGIARLLHHDYKLAKPPAVVRSVPHYQQMPFRPTGDVIHILYHGLAVPTRGLESAIESVMHWRKDFRLDIRAVGSSDYLRFLEGLTRQFDVQDRVRVLPPIPFSQLVSAANQADIGYVVLEEFGPQRTFTLPNKFFEYVMAGLALLASDLPEMAAITKRFNFGRLVHGTDPRVIAECVNALDRKAIDAFKRNSLTAAQELCWENEQERLLQACGVAPRHEY